MEPINERNELKKPNDAKVFLMNYSGHPVDDALRYGSLIPLTQGNLDFRNTDRIKFTVDEIFEKNKFNYKKDYIAIMSSPVLATIIIRTLSHVPLGKLKVLVFDQKLKKYDVREI